MRKLLIAAVAATALFGLSTIAYVITRAAGWNVDRAAFVSATVITGCASTVLWCTRTILSAVRDTMTEILDGVSTETRALHRSVITAMEEYGDSRAIGAVVAVQQRHAVNSGVFDTGERTTDLGKNVTRIRPR